MTGKIRTEIEIFSKTIKIKNPEVNIKRSTVIETISAVLIYLINSVLSMGGLPQAELAQSQVALAGIINHINGATWGEFHFTRDYYFCTR